MTEVVFFDTYALFEVVKGNENYKRYRDVNIVLTKLNLFELFYALLKEKDDTTATTALRTYSEFIVDFDNEVIEHAAKFKLAHKKEDLSMTDCIGYALAQSLGIKFLTGDQKFERKTTVEFAK